MKKIFALTILFAGIQAQASILFEPYLGYISGSTSATTVNGGKVSTTATGTGYGARLGYKFMSPLWLAAEYGMGAGSSKDSTSNSDFKSTTQSVLVGYYFGRYNLFAGYGFSDKVDYNLSGSTSSIYGTNIRAGVGYEFMNHLALIVDFYFPTYKQYSNAAVSKQDISGVYKNYDVSTFMLSLSFPFGGHSSK